MNGPTSRGPFAAWLKDDEVLYDQMRDRLREQAIERLQARVAKLQKREGIDDLLHELKLQAVVASIEGDPVLASDISQATLDLVQSYEYRRRL